LPAEVLFVLFEHKLSFWTLADKPIVLAHRLRVGSYRFAHAQDGFG
jgi:hypothetical protein